MQPIIVLYLLWVLWFLSWLAVSIASDANAHKLGTPLRYFFRLAILAATLLLFAITPWPGLDVQYRLWGHALSEESSWALTVVVLAGFALTWWADLSRLSAGPHPDGVVERGPYRYVRHPAHLGLIVAALATAAISGRPSSSAGAALYIVIFLIKTALEDRVLRDDEPSYEDYAERVPMLLPIPRRNRAPAAQASLLPGFERIDVPAAPKSDPAPDAKPVADASPTTSVQLSLSLIDDDEDDTASLTVTDAKS